MTEFFLKEPRPFTSRRDLNWFKIKVLLFSVFISVVALILFIPESRPEHSSFDEKSESGSQSRASELVDDPNSEALNQLQASQSANRTVHSSLDYLYREDLPSAGIAESNAKERNASMILARGETDGRDQLNAGTRIELRLVQRVVISRQSINIIALVSRDVSLEGHTAIPTGSKVLGEGSFDASSDRANISWRSIQFPDGRQRPLSAVSVGRDGEVGLDGKIGSDGLKNALGQTVTRFIGAYAAGSMNSGAFGANNGGNKNGVRNAIAQTATERANSMGENLQKEKRWVELDEGLHFSIVLNQPFIFRDPGSFNGE